MGRFEIDSYFDLAQDELKAAQLVLALAASPLLFFLSTFGYLGTLSALTKLVATLSVLGFAAGTITWGLATVLCQLSIVSVRYEKAKGIEGDALRSFAESAWNTQNAVTSKLFVPASIALIVGFAALAAFVLLVIWVR